MTGRGRWRGLSIVISIILAPVLLFSAGAAAAQSSAAPLILDDGRAAGYLTVGWPDAQGDSFILQIDDGDGWQTVYEGPDRASTLSGLPDGAYRFRLRPAGNGDAWSSPLRVRVAHHSLSRAFGFFGLGAAVFGILLLLLAAARRKEMEGERKGAPS